MTAKCHKSSGVRYWKRNYCACINTKITFKHFYIEILKKSFTQINTQKQWRSSMWNNFCISFNSKD